MSESVSYPTVPSYVVGIVVVSVALVMLTLVLCLLYYLAKKSFISKEHPISRFFFQRRNIRVDASEGQIEKLRESTAETPGFSHLRIFDPPPTSPHPPPTLKKCVKLK